MATIGAAPIQEDLVDPDANIPARSWLQWFADLGTALNGEWNLSETRLTAAGISVEPDESYVSSMGREVTFLFVWNSGVEFSSGSYTLSRGSLTMLPGFLQVWNNGAMVDGALCGDSNISFKDGTYSGQVIVQGTILTKIEKRRL